MIQCIVVSLRDTDPSTYCMLRVLKKTSHLIHSFVLFLVGFLPIHDPLAMHLLIFFLALLHFMSAFLCLSDHISEIFDLALHFLLHLKWLRDIQPFSNCWSSVDPIQPRFEMFETFHLNTRPFSPVDPGKGSKICNSHLITNSPWPT